MSWRARKDERGPVRTPLPRFSSATPWIAARPAEGGLPNRAGALGAGASGCEVCADAPTHRERPRQLRNEAIVFSALRVAATTRSRNGRASKSESVFSSRLMVCAAFLRSE